MGRRAKSLDEKRHDLREVARGYFERARMSRRPYTDMSLAATVVTEQWAKAKPVAKLLATETIAGWLAEMARAAVEEAVREDQPDLPGMVLYRVPGTKVRQRKSIKAATLAELRDYAVILQANATGAMAELRKVLGLIAQAEEASCGEEEEVWPYLSDEPRFPLGGAPSAAPPRDAMAQPGDLP